jgi:hypothetical protein
MPRIHLFVGAVVLLRLLSAVNAEGTRVVVAYSSINPNSSQLEIAASG